jgi:hypothetical protein
MRFTPLQIEGAWLAEQEPHADARGSFARTFCEREFAAQGLAIHFPQHSRSRNAPEAFVGFKLARLRAEPDTLTRAAEWFITHADREHDRIAIAPTLALPLLRKVEFVPDFRGVDNIAFSLWPDYQAGLRPSDRAGLDWALFAVPIQGRRMREEMERDPDAFVRNLDARYVVVDVNHDQRRPLLDVLRDAVIRHGRLVAHFGPRERTLPGDVPILYHLDGPGAPDAHFAWRAARYAAQGPDVEIYELMR